MSLDYGSAVSQKGYDVKTCADRFLVYSSAFCSLKIFGRYQVSGISTITITHNLGYYAPFVVINESNGSIFNPNNNMPQQSVNDLKITAGNYTVYIFLENFADFTSPNINTGTTNGSSSSDYGIRVSKDGYDVKTCTDDQLVFSSSFFTSIVHKKGSNKPSGGLLEVAHGLGYVPDYLAFAKKDGESYITFFNGYSPNIGAELRYSRIDSTNLTLAKLDRYPEGDSYYTNMTYYYIIFKNPLT